MLKNEITIEEECPRCFSIGMKQLPAMWTDEGVITEFYSGHMFCPVCGGRAFIGEGRGIA